MSELQEINEAKKASILTIKEGDYIARAYYSNNFNDLTTTEEKMKVIKVEEVENSITGQTDVRYHTETCVYSDMTCVKVDAPTELSVDKKNILKESIDENFEALKIFIKDGSTLESCMMFIRNIAETKKQLDSDKKQN